MKHQTDLILQRLTQGWPFPIHCGPVIPLRARKPDAPCYSMKAAADGAGEIFIYDVIGDAWDGTTAKSFAKDLRALGKVAELRININSPGGSVFDGVAIFNQLARHPAHKTVSIDGLAASIASVIAMAGDEITMAENGMIMIHNPWTIGVGTAEDFRALADTLDKIGGTILNTYTERSGGDAAEIAAMMAAETWMDADEALERGFIDRVGEEINIAAKARGFDLSAFKHAPDDLVRAAKAAARAPKRDYAALVAALRERLSAA